MSRKHQHSIPLAYYNTYTDFQKWYQFNANQEMPMQAFIEVRWDTMEMIYKKFEIEKNNQIQYIGDVKYRVKEFDPCGYSTITVKDEDDDKREALILFDEDASAIDNTDNYFEITTGEKAKLISITLGNLKHKGVYSKIKRVQHVM